MISQRRRDMERLELVEADQAVLQSDLRAAEGTRTRLQAAVAARDRDLGQLENQVGAVCHFLQVKTNIDSPHFAFSNKSNSAHSRKHDEGV